MISGEANKRWAESLAQWAIPDELVAAAPAPPYFFDPSVFAAASDEAIARVEDTPSDELARETLPPGATVLDVGCGAGAASLRLRPHQLIGVDTNPPMLEALADRARQLGVDATTVSGSWCEVAPGVAMADVVVCHHVFYNVADLAAFASALDAHARRRVVVELTAVHPMTWMAPYWKALHGLELPHRPIADDAVAVLEDLDFSVGRRAWSRPYQMIGESGDNAMRSMARRLCLPASRYEELSRLMAAVPPPPQRDVVTLWWDSQS
jgi:SAM-dependent methyltransferase